jgi:acyl carrier protein
LNPKVFMELSKRYTTKVQMKALEEMVTPNDMINDFLRQRRF